MKKYLLRFLFFWVTYLTLSWIYSLITPFYYANQQFSAKHKSYEPKKELYNTLFFGNSQINRHVDPSTFDSINRGATYSFNFAADASPFLELSYLVEHSLDKFDAKNYIVIISKSGKLRPANLYKPRMNYYHDFRRYRMSMRINNDKSTQMKYHTVAFIMNKTRSIFDQFLSITFENDPLISHYKQGFLAYDKESEIKNITWDKAERLSFYSAIIPPLKTIKYNTAESFDAEDKLIIEEANRLNDLAISQDKKLYFLFMPNDQNHKRYELPNTIYLGDGEVFPEFYEPENYFNKTHLNEKGAIEFSKRLGKVFLEMQQ